MLHAPFQKFLPSLHWYYISKSFKNYHLVIHWKIHFYWETTSHEIENININCSDHKHWNENKLNCGNNKMVGKNSDAVIFTRNPAAKQMLSCLLYIALHFISHPWPAQNFYPTCQLRFHHQLATAFFRASNEVTEKKDAMQGKTDVNRQSFTRFPGSSPPRAYIETKTEEKNLLLMKRNWRKTSQLLNLESRSKGLKEMRFLLSCDIIFGTQAPVRAERLKWATNFSLIRTNLP